MPTKGSQRPGVLFAYGWPETDSVLRNCTLCKADGSPAVTLARLQLEGCALRYGGEPLTLSGCTLGGCTFKTIGKTPQLVLASSALTCENATEANAFPASFACNASTLRVKGSVAADAFGNVAFSGASRIVLDRYSSAALTVGSGVLGTDYVVECNGTEALT